MLLKESRLKVKKIDSPTIQIFLKKTFHRYREKPIVTRTLDHPRELSEKATFFVAPGNVKIELQFSSTVKNIAERNLLFFQQRKRN